MRLSEEGKRPQSRFSPRRAFRQEAQANTDVSSTPTRTQDPVKVTTDTTFDLLLPPIKKALSERKYTIPTEVQRQCIPHILDGHDMLGSAQTGTGKTAAFTLPLLQRVALDRKPYRSKHARVLILAPTRELAVQIRESIQSYGAHLKVRETVVYGGVSQRPQEQAMRQGVDFLVATPGRLMDLVGQGIIRLDGIEALVLDEADRMLDMGFIHEIRRIISLLPKERQTLFFSATLSSEIRSLAGDLTRNPMSVSIAPEDPTVDRIAQKVFFVDSKKKHSLLLSVLDKLEARRVIVFTQMKHVANKLAEKLNKSGVRASAIHGNKSQSARMKALDSFRSGRIRVLVATDVAARGIDVDGITHVVNYELPKEPATYVHRIGRTARAGSEGKALSFCSADERGQLKGIERMIRKPIPADHEHDFHCPLAARPLVSRPASSTSSADNRSRSDARRRRWSHARPPRNGQASRKGRSRSKAA
jgi:ATP-dependent RNA helicase RhlE